MSSVTPAHGAVAALCIFILLHHLHLLLLLIIALLLPASDPLSSHFLSSALRFTVAVQPRQRGQRVRRCWLLLRMDWWQPSPSLELARRSGRRSQQQQRLQQRGMRRKKRRRRRVRAASVPPSVCTCSSQRPSRAANSPDPLVPRLLAHTHTSIDSSPAAAAAAERKERTDDELGEEMRCERACEHAQASVLALRDEQARQGKASEEGRQQAIERRGGEGTRTDNQR